MENRKWKLKKNRKPTLVNYLQVFLYFQAAAKLLLICLVEHQTIYH